MEKVISLTFLTVLFMCMSIVESKAQYQSRKGKKNKHRFNAGLVLGSNFSQIDGDKFTGFDKTGIRGGLKGMMYLNKKLDFTTGLLFVQRGSRFENADRIVLRKVKEERIHLEYMEVPMLLTVKTLKKDGKGYRFDFGGSFARLINSRVEEKLNSNNKSEISYSALEEQFQSNEINLIAGCSYFFNRRIGIGIQYTLQVNKLYDNPSPEATPDTPFYVPASTFRTNEVRLLRNYQIGLQLVYHIF